MRDRYLKEKKGRHKKENFKILGIRQSSNFSKESGCKLIITQGDFHGADNAEKRFEESKHGWKMVIPIMKKLMNE